MEGEWENSGFERNEKGEVILIWECIKCGYEVGAGLNPPPIPCPHCNKENNE